MQWGTSTITSEVIMQRNNQNEYILLDRFINKHGIS